MAAKQPPQPVPAGLGATGKRLWAGLHETYGFLAHEEVVLLEACRCADRLDRLNTELGKRLAEEVRARKLREARAQQLNLARLVASLRLPSDESGARPQRRGGARGTYQAEVG